MCDRIRAVLAHDEGYTYADISRMWLLDDETIRRHVKDDWEQDKLAPQSGVTSSKLNEEQTEALVHHLSEQTYEQVEAIVVYVKRTYDIQYTVSGMTDWLHRQGFSYKQLTGIPAKADG